MSTATAASPRVSVVMVTYNRCEEACRSLERLRALSAGYPVIVVDNGSDDNTACRVRDLFPGVMVIRAPRNLGAAGRNLGVERVKTPYVAFSDDDVWWAPDALETAADLLDAHPGIAVLNARIQVGPEARPDPACEAMSNSPIEGIAGVGPRITGFMAGACVMRTHAFMEAGGYWPPLFIGGEEALLAMDILDTGGSIVYAPMLVAYHWPSTLRDSVLRRRMLARNAIWTAWLRLPASMALRQSRHVLASLPDSRMRLQSLGDALSGFALVARNRRVLRPATCALLERVWNHEHQGRQHDPARA